MKTDKYSDISKKELIEILQNRDNFIASFIEEQEQYRGLNMKWTGNLGHWYWSVKTNTVKFNPLKVKALGYTESEVPLDCGFEFFTEKLHPGDYEDVMQNMRDHLEGRTDSYDAEYRIASKDGGWRWFYDRGKITRRDTDGSPLLVTGIVFDITPKKNLEQNQAALIETLKSQLKLKENLYSSIIHDLKSPISNIIGFTDLLKARPQLYESREKLEEFVDIINRSGTKAISVANNLMSLIKAKKSDTELIEDTKICMTTDNIIDDFAEEIKSKDIKIKKSVIPGSTIKTSGSILKIAIRNILSNAIKFSRRGGTVTIAYSGYVLSVTDEGKGMTEEELRSIFSADKTSLPGTENETGSGVGLLLVKELLEEINVKMDIASAEGSGTKISLIFPNG